MLTRKLHKAFQETDKLTKFLIKRDWDRADELTAIIDRANAEIEKIADDAILEVLLELNGRYLEEAQTWARNQTDVNKISLAIRKLRDIRN